MDDVPSKSDQTSSSSVGISASDQSWPSFLRYLVTTRRGIGAIAVVLSLVTIVVPTAIYGLMRLANYDPLKLLPRALPMKSETERNLIGKWIYGLMNQTTGKRIYGIFEIEECADGMLGVKSGISWYAPGRPEIPNQRGIWTSRHILYRDGELVVVFRMQSTDPSAVPSNYRGVLDLSVSDGTVHGIFRDLDERHESKGTITARNVTSEHLGSFTDWASRAEREYAK